VFAAASLTDAFNELGRRLEQQNPGVRVRFNYAGSQQLVLQLQQGAEADVFASADGRWMRAAQEDGLLAGSATLFARNRLVVLVPGANPARVDALADLARPGLKIVLAAEAVPAGRYTRQALDRLAGAPGLPADYAFRVLANVVSEEDNVKAVVNKVELGEADAGFVYRSDVTPGVARATKVLEIPDRYDAMAAYPIALLRGSKHVALARRFLELVLGDSGQAVLERHGLTRRSASETPAENSPP
jgi:molybdate transport system substrate-binding protein